jgi:AraC-like DNA-binding protein/Tfp pilus assembly protein PilF
MRCFKQTFIFVLLMCSSMIASGQSVYISRLKEAAALLPSRAVEADSALGVILEEISAQQPPSDSLFVLTCFLLGTSNLYQGKLNLALDYYNRSLYHNQRIILPKEYQDCLINSAVIFDSQYRLKEASQTYQKALEYAEQSGDSSSIADIWLNLGVLSHRMKDDEKAVEILEKIYTYYSTVRDTLRMSTVLNNIATCYYPSNLPVAETNLKKSLELRKQIKAYYYIAFATNNLAELETRQKNYSEARRLLQENISLCEQKGLMEALSMAHRLVGLCEIESGGNLGTAASSLEKSRELALKTGRTDYQRDIREAEILLQARAGNFDGVKKMLEEYKTMNDESAQENARVVNSEFQTIHEVKKITRQKDLLEEGISIRNRQLILSLLALLAAALAVGIIASQYIRLRRTMKTMYRMNVELANNTAISMKSLNQDILQDDAADTDADGTEEENINLSNLYITVLRRIESEKLYLNPEFSMQVLSELVNRRQRYVSQALSEVGKTSFPNLVNNLRINEARRLIADNPNITVIEIMEKTGFGSRQNFNRSFKQATGFTPSEYQQRASDSHS